MHWRCFYTVLIDAYCKLDGWSFKAVVSGMPCLWVFAMTASTKTIKISLWKHTKINPLPEGGALQHNQYKLVQQYLMVLVSCFKPFCSAELTKCCCVSSLLDCAKWRCISKWVAGPNAAISYPCADGFKFGKVVQDWSQLRFHLLELKKINLFTALRLFFPLL